MATNRKKVLVPDNMGQQGKDVLLARDDIDMVTYSATIAQADLLPLLADASGVALSGTPYKQIEMDASPAMQVVARIGVGYDAVEVPALTARRVPLMVAGIANSTSVAEQAFHMMIALAKQNRALDGVVRNGKWGDRREVLPMELSGKTVLIVGFGRIGTRTARRCLGFDMQVLVYDPYVDAAVIAAAGCRKVDDLDAALPGADFVCIHCPKTPETVGMFNAVRFARMKPGAFIVNTARGGIIEETALHAALTGGHVAGAGLDVFEAEPTPGENPLLKLPNVIASPHNSASVAMARGVGLRRMGENCRRALVGEEVRNLIGPEDRLK